MRVRIHVLTALLLCVASVLPAQQAPTGTPVPATPAAPAPPSMIDLRMIRMKISAGDLPSAESILEVHRAEKGEDAEYLLGLAWLARGAVLTRDWKAASGYAKSAREHALEKLGTPADYENNPEATYALGTSIEVDAQALVAAGKKKEAIRLLVDSARAQEKAPFNLRARIWKRRNQIELVGQRAPDFGSEDHLDKEVPALETLRQPVVLFFWWEACGDCKMQAAAFRKTVEKYAPKGVAFIAPTRFYETDRAVEKGKIEKAWKEIYNLPDSVTVPISEEAMLRYGASATPTFAFVDRKGIVTRYLPYRMTEERLSQAIEELLR